MPEHGPAGPAYSVADEYTQRPFLNAVATDCTRWLEAHRLADSRACGEVGRLSASYAYRCWTAAGADELLVLTQWCSLSLLVDDALDSPGGRADQHLGAYADHLVSLGRSACLAEAAQRASGSSGFVAAFDDLLARLGPRMGQDWVRRFLRHCLLSLEAFGWEAGNRAEACWPSLASYQANRPHSSASLVNLDLVEYAARAPLTPDQAAHEDVVALRRLAADCTAWHNDLVSWPKERAQGDPHNLVLLLAHHELMPLPQAEGEVRLRISARLAELHCAADRLARSVPGTEAYGEAVRAWAHGLMTWHNVATNRFESSHAPT